MKTQIADQTGKGAILAFVAYAFRDNPELGIVVLPAVSAVLAWVSTLVGNPDVASFLDKAKKEVAEAVTEAAKPKK